MMAGNSISLEEMATEIEAALEEYSEEVTEETKRVVKQVAKNAVAKLKQTSPKKTGVYAKGWTSKVAYESSEDIRIQVYNRKKPKLTHLLENGHAKQNGGRAAAIPHIRPVEQEVVGQLQKKIKVAIK